MHVELSVPSSSVGLDFDEAQLLRATIFHASPSLALYALCDSSYEAVILTYIGINCSLRAQKTRTVRPKTVDSRLQAGSASGSDLSPQGHHHQTLQPLRWQRHLDCRLMRRTVPLADSSVKSPWRNPTTSRTPLLRSNERTFCGGRPTTPHQFFASLFSLPFSSTSPLHSNTAQIQSRRTSTLPPSLL